MISTVRRLRISARGLVQGVGFRPYIHKLAREEGIRGFVRNRGGAVEIDAEGSSDALETFLDRLERSPPENAVLHGVETARLEPAGHVGFVIRSSGGASDSFPAILPDLAPCADCLRELRDPADRRHRHPFISCTHCGPRYTIMDGLPYDRPRTAMARFPMCPACLEEYRNPDDRRFHAQTVACPDCGPRLSLVVRGRETANGDAALRTAVDMLRAGKVVAVKGIGGFHLLTDAASEAAVARLRRRKHREEKPFALMARDLEQARTYCGVSDMEARALRSRAAPIVLLTRRPDAGLPGNLAPGTPRLGFMLPSSPLHHLLLDAFDGPVVATSGNRSEEPICTENGRAFEVLGDVADLFLVHDRPIRRHCDDSILHIVDGHEQLLRRARGFAPLPLRTPPVRGTVLACGAHQKCAVAFSRGEWTWPSQHLGDLETESAVDAHARVVRDLEGLLNLAPDQVACDAHPDYASTRYALGRNARPRRVQHHLAHVLACMAEHGVDGPVLGVAWDGTGFGDDGTIWGGEFLEVEPDAHTRRASLRPFRLPGGDAAAREPWRSGLAVLGGAYGTLREAPAGLPCLAELDGRRRDAAAAMLRSGVGAPPTSSMGRLFDAVAWMLLGREKAGFEGQAAMELESAAGRAAGEGSRKFSSVPGIKLLGGTLDWRPLVRGLADGVLRGADADALALAFHGRLAGAIVDVAREARLPRVMLTGGCFQNRLLTETALRSLRGAGFHPYIHHQVPPNDGGVALGQAAAAAWKTRS